MVPRLTSRRSVLAGVGSVLAVGTSGCLGDDSRYRTLLRNESASSVSGRVRVKTKRSSASAETTVDLPPDSSTSVVVAARPTQTEVDLDSTRGQSNFSWSDTPSCYVGGLPTQTVTVDGDTVGVDYGCKRHDE